MLKNLKAKELENALNFYKIFEFRLEIYLKFNLKFRILILVFLNIILTC